MPRPFSICRLPDVRRWSFSAISACSGKAGRDADPAQTPGLVLLEDGTKADDLIPIGIQADRMEWRVFARYSQGAFDPEFGLQHGWKQTPRFDLLGVTYSAPGRVMRSTDR